MARRGGRLHAIICDVCAFANTNGGTVYIGASANAKTPPLGIESVPESINSLRTEIERHITPPLPVTIDALDSQGKKVLRVVVPQGSEPPYAVDENKIYIRNETETNLAVRDEIVALSVKAVRASEARTTPTDLPQVATATESGTTEVVQIVPPKTGVEILEVEERKGNRYYSMRDLRNGAVVHNVTQQSARRLWQYAISQSVKHPVKLEDIRWHGTIGLLKKYRRADKQRYDLVQRDAEGNVHVYYGVTDDGIDGPWRDLIGSENQSDADRRVDGE
jgi:hypothetical protein